MGFLGGIGSALVGGLLGGIGGGKPDTSKTQVQDLPEWMKPYYTGGEDKYGGNAYVPPPLSTDSIHWNTMAGRGYMNGPPPPMFTNDPRYTGENVYDAPRTYIPSGPPGLNLTGSPTAGGQPGGMGSYLPQMLQMGGQMPQMGGQMPQMGGQMPQMGGGMMGGMMPRNPLLGQMQNRPGNRSQGLPTAPPFPGTQYPSETRPQQPAVPAPAPAPAPAEPALGDRDWMRLQSYLQQPQGDPEAGRVGGFGLNYLQSMANQVPQSANPFGRLGPAGLSSGGLDWLRGASNQDFSTMFPGTYRDPWGRG